MDSLDLLAVQGTLKSLLQHHSSKASILQLSAFFIVQLSHPYLNTGKTIALTWWTFVGIVMSLLFNMLSRLVINFLPRSKCLIISWLPLPSAVILDKVHYFADPKINHPHFKVSIFYESIYLVRAFDHKYKNFKHKWCWGHIYSVAAMIPSMFHDFIFPLNPQYSCMEWALC